MSHALSFDSLEENRLAPWWPPTVPEQKPAETLSADRAGAEAVADGVLVMRLSNFPTEENVAAAAAWRPEAEPLLRRWKEIWDRSFPTDDDRSFHAKHKNEEPGEYYSVWYDGNAKRKAEALEKGDTAAASVCVFWEENRSKLVHPGMRDWRAHVIDDAETVCSLAEAHAGDAWLSLGDLTVVLDGFWDDGLPRLRYAPTRTLDEAMSAILRRNRPNDDHPYWHSPAFLKHAGRPFRTAKHHHEMSIVLLAMAEAGHPKAFLKGVDSKSGTWTVDLSQVRDPTDAVGALYRATMPWGLPSKGVMVQEHVPFTHEQRFFVIGGRIVASVCSDRHFSAADKCGRILDERIAVLRVPEIGEGNFDRGVTLHVVDRALAARFARKARALARDLAAEGVTDYVVDMGLAADGRGVLPIELNSLYMSGPYCLDRTRIVRARNRLRTGAIARVGSDVRVVAAASRDCRGDDGTVAAEIAQIAMAGFGSLSDVVSKLVVRRSENLPSGPKGPRPGAKGIFLRLQGIDKLVDSAAETRRCRLKAASADAEPSAALAAGAGGALDDVAFAFLRGTPVFSVPVAAADGAVVGRFCGSLVDVGDGRRLALAAVVAGSGSLSIGLVREEDGHGRTVPQPAFLRHLTNDADKRCHMETGGYGVVPLFSDASGNLAWCESKDVFGPESAGASVFLRRPDGSELGRRFSMQDGDYLRVATATRDASDGSVVWRRRSLPFMDSSSSNGGLVRGPHRTGGPDEAPSGNDVLMRTLTATGGDPEGFGGKGAFEFDEFGYLDVPLEAPFEEPFDPMLETVGGLVVDPVPLSPGSGTKAEAAATAFLPDGAPVFSVPLDFSAADGRGTERRYALRLVGSMVKDDEPHPPTIVVSVAGTAGGEWYSGVLSWHGSDEARCDPWKTGDVRLPRDACAGRFERGAFVLFDCGDLRVSLRWIPNGRRGSVEVLLDKGGRLVGSLLFDPWSFRPEAAEMSPEVAGLAADGGIDDGISVDPAKN